jgi:hypothetical protein
MKQGTIFILTSGCYSDFGIYEVMRAKADFDFDDVVATVPKDSHSIRKLVDRLLETGLAESVSAPAIWLGEYGSIETPTESFEVTMRKRYPSPDRWVRQGRE